MAFPLTFMDHKGVVRHYRWEGYPEKVVDWSSVRVAKWTDGSPDPLDVNPVKALTVYCGPPAPLPRPPTADEFRDGLARWMADTEWSWLSH